MTIPKGDNFSLPMEKSQSDKNLFSDLQINDSFSNTMVICKSLSIPNRIVEISKSLSPAMKIRTA